MEYICPSSENGASLNGPLAPFSGRDRHGHLLESPAVVSRRAVPTARCSFWVGIVYEQSRRESVRDEGMQATIDHLRAFSLRRLVILLRSSAEPPVPRSLFLICTAVYFYI